MIAVETLSETRRSAQKRTTPDDVDLWNAEQPTPELHYLESQTAGDAASVAWVLMSPTCAAA
jgi:hypothetical protein